MPKYTRFLSRSSNFFVGVLYSLLALAGGLFILVAPSFAQGPAENPGQESPTSVQAPSLIQVLNSNADASQFSGTVKIGGSGAVLQIGNGAVAALSNIEGSITNNALVITVPQYQNTNYFPGLVWSTGNQYAGVPKMGIWGQMTDSGSRMYLGTSNNYRNGITNQAITIDPTGLVGIGTAAPSERLDVAGGIRVGSFVQGAITGSARIGRASDSTQGEFVVQTGTPSATFRLVDNAWSKTIASFSGAAPVNSFILNSSGSVGIGTATPAEKLDVNGAIKSNGPIYNINPSGYAQTSLQSWGLYSPGTMYIEPGKGAILWLTDQWAGTGSVRAVMDHFSVGPDSNTENIRLFKTGDASFSGTIKMLTGSNPVLFSSGWTGFPDTKTNQAEISNDVGTYKTLMIVGNKSYDGSTRRVSVWDRLEVNGNLAVTGRVSAKELCLSNGCKSNWNDGPWTRTPDNDIYNNNEGNVSIRSSRDNVLNLQTTDNTWLYTQWLTKEGTRRVWMGLDSNLAWFNIQPENGTQGTLLGGKTRVDTLTFLGTGGDSGRPPEYYGIYQESGPWTNPFPDLRIQYHTGIKYDAYAGYGGHRFYTGYDGTANPTGLQLSIDNGVTVENGLRVKGSVGIGTTSPGRKIEVYGGAADTFVHIDSNDNYKSGIEFAEQGFSAYDKVFRWGVKQYYDGVDDIFHIDPVRNTTQGTGLRMDGNGRVGIGTNPGSKLHVQNDNQDNTAFQGLLRLGVNNADESVDGNFNEVKPSYGIEFRRKWYGSGDKLQAGIYAWGSSNWSSGLAFRTAQGDSNLGTRMVITGNGKVGIGTTNPGPAYQLDVNGIINATGITINGDEVVSSQWRTGAENKIYRFSGNVGIGIIDPDSKLHIRADSPTMLKLDRSSTSVEGGLTFADNKAIKWYMYQNNGGNDLNIQQNGVSGEGDDTPRIRLPGNSKNVLLALSGGNVGIGTTSPQGKLDVFGDRAILRGGLDIGGGSSENWIRGFFNLPLAFYVRDNSGNASQKMIISQNGNVGIGTGTTSPSGKLTVKGWGPGGIIRVQPDTNGSEASIGFKQNADGTGKEWVMGQNSWGAGAGNFAIGIGGEGTYGWGVIYVNQGGQVGIRTASPCPGCALDVQGGNVNVGYLGNSNFADLSPKEKLAFATDRIGLDVAELFETREEVEAGDVLVMSREERKLKKSSAPYEAAIIGVVSGSPALVFEGSNLKLGAQPDRFEKGNKPPVALAGRIPVKVSLENGPIRVGDYITSSSKSGVAMKATKPGMTLGVALENFDGTKEEAILVFLNIGVKNVETLLKELQTQDKELLRRIEALEKK